MDADDPSGLTAARRPNRARVPDRGRTSRGPRAFTAGVAVLAWTLMLASPVAGVDPLPGASLAIDLPSPPLPTLPVATLKLPTLPVPTPKPPTAPPLPTILPTLPLPTVRLPTPTLPLPTPTLPLPTPTLSLPTPTLPLPTPTLPLPTASTAPSSRTGPTGSGSTASGGPAGSSEPSGAPIAAGPLGGSPGPETVASVPPEEGTNPAFGGQGFGSLVLPGLLIGVPAIVIVGILAAQVAVGAAWLPVIRRWLNRRV